MSVERAVPVEPEAYRPVVVAWAIPAISDRPVVPRAMPSMMPNHGTRPIKRAAEAERVSGEAAPATLGGFGVSGNGKAGRDERSRPE